jgi:hypothetical protein
VVASGYNSAVLRIILAIALMSTGAWAQSVSTIAGRISHPDGTPVPDAPVFAAVAGAGGQLRTVATAVSAWDGQYRLAGLAPGQYVIGARLKPAAPVTYYPSAADARRRQAITVFDGVPAEGIDIWLQPLPQRYSVSGRIYWPEGRSLSNLAIEYGGPSNPNKGIWYVFDPGGLFSIDGTPPGPMVMLARADTDAGPLIGIASTDVSVAPVEDVTIVLAPPGSIDGRVVFERPLPAGHATPEVVLVHSLLAVSSLYPTESGAVDASGRFHIASARGVYGFRLEGLPAGWTVKRVRRNGRNVSIDRLTVGAGEVVTGVEVMAGPAAAGPAGAGPSAAR